MIRFALVAASTLGFVLTAALGNLMVPLLRELENTRARQTRKEEKEEKQPEAQPAPTLGGLCLMVGTLTAAGMGWMAACIAQPELLGSDRLLMSRLLLTLFGALAFGAVGLAEDLVRLRTGSPLGLRRGVRLSLEAAAAAAELLLLGAAAPLLWGLVLVALAESARAADGADGTVCGASFVTMLGLMVLETQLGWFPLAVLPAALAGALMAFLLWNFPPAKMHPGRCGSLFLAGMIGCGPLCMGYAELSVPLALPFWAEGGMVLLQILHFRCTGRPLFRAAPLHRWLEKRGVSAVNIFYTICVLSVCGLLLAMRLVR